jgi:hypothetical protein
MYQNGRKASREEVSSCSLSGVRLANYLAQCRLTLAIAFWDILPFRETNGQGYSHIFNLKTGQKGRFVSQNTSSVKQADGNEGLPVTKRLRQIIPKMTRSSL